MEDLENQKLKEEIAKLKTERYSIQFKTAFDFIKTALIFVGGVFAFFWIQSPESILKRESSKVQISSTRFTDLKEILDEKDLGRKQQLIIAFKAAYSDGSDWLENLNFLESQQAQKLPLDAVAKLSNNKQLIKLIEEKQTLVKRLEEQYQNEIEFGSLSGRGVGPKALQIRKEIEKLNTEISELLQDISSES